MHMPGSHDYHTFTEAERAAPAVEAGVREYNALGQATGIFEDHIGDYGPDLHSHRLGLQPNTAIDNSQF